VLELKRQLTAQCLRNAAYLLHQLTICSNTSARLLPGDSMFDASSKSPDPIPESPEEQLVYYRNRLDEVAELVARIRHEINNPLTGVLGQAQLLLREELSERARKRAQTIEELAIRMRDIVAQLREVQKPNADTRG